MADLQCGSLKALDTIITPSSFSYGRPCPSTPCLQIHANISTHMTNLKNIASAQGILPTPGLDADSIFCQLTTCLDMGKKYDIQLILDALSYVVDMQMAICAKLKNIMNSRSFDSNDFEILQEQVYGCSRIVDKIRKKYPYSTPSIVPGIYLEHYGA